MTGHICPLEGDAAELLGALTKAEVFPQGATWWFAWDDAEIVLPRPLSGVDNPADDRWDVARVFSEKAELRLARVGGRRRAWLLAEDADAMSILPAAGECESFHADGSGHRVLWGGDLRMRGEVKHGEVRFPRTLDYGMPVGEKRRVVAEVVRYLDDAGAVRATRFRTLKVVPEGSIRTPTLRGPAGTEGER